MTSTMRQAVRPWPARDLHAAVVWPSGMRAGRRTPRTWRELVGWSNMSATAIQHLDPTVWWSDPLSDPAVIDLALSFPPSVWVKYGSPRGLAREVMQGLVPDEIRLRTERGLQSADVGVSLIGQEAAYAQAISDMRKSPTAAKLLDLDLLARIVDEGIPDDPTGAYWWEVEHGRIIALGDFCARWESGEMLAAGPVNGR